MLFQQRSIEVIKIRLVNSDGRDELYINVIKYIVTKSNHLIYTDISTFTIPVYEVEFVQAWDEASE